MKVATASLLVLVGGASGVVSAQQPTPTPASAVAPAEQHVVAPSLPDQRNKEGKVKPGGGIPTDEYGNILTSPGGAIDPSAPKPTPGAAAPSTGATRPGAAGTASGPAPARTGAPAPSPTGKTVIGAANLSVRGTVKAYAKGVSITVVEANGRERTVKVAEKASVYEGLAPGDKVVLRIPLAKPADGKTADKIEKQKPPKQPPKSKFAEAQSPAS